MARIKHTSNGNVKITLAPEVAELLHTYLRDSMHNPRVSNDSWGTLAELADNLAEAGVGQTALQ